MQNLNGTIYDGLAPQALRFQNVEIPQGAIITGAYFVKTAKYNSGYTSSTVIRGVDVDDMAPFTMASGEITAFPKVTSTAVWNMADWTTNKRYKSSDFSAVVQDIVNRPGWVSGNAMGIIADDPGESFSIGNSHISYSAGVPDKAPELYITYQTAFTLGTRTVRDELLDLVSGLTAQGSTPISGVMAEAASYYRGDDVYFGQNRGFAPNDEKRRFYRTSHEAAIIGGTRNLPAGCYDSESSIKECHAETITGSPSYQSPIADICQTNNIVLLSDGIPNNNWSSVENIIEPIIVGDGNTSDGFLGYPGCDSAADGADCTLKLSEALANEDQETITYNGIQTIQTHTIGFDLAAGGSAAQFLEDVATAGKGGSYSANNAGSLVGVFEAIVRSLEREARTFVSAGVSVNQANRLTHRDELYFGLFKPDTDTVWSGNLKRYRLSTSTIKDANSVDAVNSEGRFKDLAQSFWSTVIDGDAVEIGGAASNMTATRRIFTNITADPITDANNAVDETNVNITNMDVAALDAIDRTNILKWARGVTAAGTARKQMGDPLHSRPVVVTYDDGTATGSPMVFVGTNQGYLHAIDTATGVENWAFIPKTLLQNLTLFEKNSVVANHVYGLDGEISLYHDDVDSDSLIDSGETAILYVGMRRGGRNYYAFDVSTRNTPVLKFIIQGGSGDYAELGQSWSKVIPGKIRLNGTETRVIAFGGGYDTNQDNIGVHLPDAIGRTVFIADAVTGARIWDARVHSTAPVSGTSAVSTLTNSIPSDIKAVDFSGSGLIEHIYASDTGGQVFRFDINNYTNTGSSNLAVGGRLANLQTGAATEENNRRFYYSPDVAAIRRINYEDFIAVSIGTGYRAHPVNNAINDKFYVIRDKWVLNNKTFPNLPGDVDENDLADVSSVVGDSNADGISDALALIENTAAPKQGWFIDFRQTGEKVLAESVTFNSKVIFTTYRPNLNGVGSGVCEAPEGSSRAYVLNLIDGTPAIDTNTDGDLLDITTGPNDTTSCGDRCVELGRGIPSRGLILFQPEGATICFGTQCFDNMLSFQGDRLQRVKWRKQNP
jgi:type IV pilus assembly protein PilY1